MSISFVQITIACLTLDTLGSEYYSNEGVLSMNISLRTAVNWKMSRVSELFQVEVLLSNTSGISVMISFKKTAVT